MFRFWFNLNRKLNPRNIYVYQFTEWDNPDVQLSKVPASTIGGTFGEAFDQATQKAEHIHFNLESISDPNKYAKEHGGNGSLQQADYYTAWELYKVKEKLCAKTTFYEDGINPSSSAWLKICQP
jgi:hypothetical protein